MKTNFLKKFSWQDAILFQDEDFTIINKPPGLSTLEDRSSDQSVLGFAKMKNDQASPAHRLDKDTSGVLVIANHSDAYKYFAEKLEHREVKKVYHAVVDGIKSFENFEAAESLHSSSNKTHMDRDGKPSLTLIQSLEFFKKHTLLKCFPVTGRMHQIRVHLAHHRSPIVHDALYGGPPAFLSDLKKNFNLGKFEEERPMISRLALHARSITFVHPKTGETVEVEASYPKDFDVFVKQLRKFS